MADDDKPDMLQQFKNDMARAVMDLRDESDPEGPAYGLSPATRSVLLGMILPLLDSFAEATGKALVIHGESIDDLINGEGELLHQSTTDLIGEVFMAAKDVCVALGNRLGAANDPKAMADRALIETFVTKMGAITPHLEEITIPDPDDEDDEEEEPDAAS